MPNTPVIISAVGRNGRAQFLWQGGAGAVSWNCYRDGAQRRTGIRSPLWVDFGLTNGHAYSYTFSGVDAGGNEGAQSAPVAVTPAAPTASVYRYRRVLGHVLRGLIVADALPAINSAMGVDAAARGGSPLMTLSDSSVVRGDLYAVSEPTLCVEVMGESIDVIASGQYGADLTTHITFKLPDIGQGLPEQMAFAGDVVVDTVRDMLTSAANYVIPALSEASGNPLLPGASCFTDCRLVRTMRLNVPTPSGDTVTRIPAWLMIHRATAEFPLDKPMSVGG